MKTICVYGAYIYHHFHRSGTHCKYIACGVKTPETSVDRMCWGDKRKTEENNKSTV